MLQMVVNNVSVDLDTLVIHTMVVMNHHDLYANQIHALQMVNVSFKKMVNQFVSVHLEWAVIQTQKDVMVMNVTKIVIALIIMLVWDSDAVIRVQDHVALEPIVKWKNIIQFVIVTMV